MKTIIARLSTLLHCVSAWQMTVAAGTLWIASLFFVAISDYTGHRANLGWELLLTGPFALFIPNFAWLANIFFLMAAGRLTSTASAAITSSAAIPAIIALILSLDLFRLTEISDGKASFPICVFHTISITDSTAFRSRIPRQNDQ